MDPVSNFDEPFSSGSNGSFPSSDMKDLNLAKQHYFRCREVDPSGLHAPVTLALAALACHL